MPEKQNAKNKISFDVNLSFASKDFEGAAAPTNSVGAAALSLSKKLCFFTNGSPTSNGKEGLAPFSKPFPLAAWILSESGGSFLKPPVFQKMPPIEKE